MLRDLVKRDSEARDPEGSTGRQTGSWVFVSDDLAKPNARDNLKDPRKDCPERNHVQQNDGGDGRPSERD